MVSSFATALLEALTATAWQLACVLGPLAASAVVLHQLQRMLAGVLTSTFGPRAMLFTGWLGVPIHELGHVAACLTFMHEIEEVRLFSPDPETGSLGLVRHHAPAGNPWAQIGRLFIAVAPLAGGAVALGLAAHLLMPDVDLFRDPLALSGPAAAVGRAWTVAAAMLDPARLVDWRAWVFLYVATCVGAHLAPSSTDLRDGVRGALALVATLLVVNLVAESFGGLPAAPIERAAALTTPVVALMIVTALVCAFVLAVLVAITAAVERLRGARGHLGRFARTHWIRLALATSISAAFVMAAL